MFPLMICDMQIRIHITFLNNDKNIFPLEEILLSQKINKNGVMFNILAQ